MDTLPVAYYAAICCALAGIAPYIPSGVRRYLVGAIVGGISAVVLPVIRGVLGG